MIYEKQNWFFRNPHLVEDSLEITSPHHPTSWDISPGTICRTQLLGSLPASMLGQTLRFFWICSVLFPRTENCSDRQPLRSNDLCLLTVSFWGPPVATSELRWSAEAYSLAESVKIRLIGLSIEQTRAIALPNCLCFLTAWTSSRHKECPKQKC